MVIAYIVRCHPFSFALSCCTLRKRNCCTATYCASFLYALLCIYDLNLLLATASAALSARISNAKTLSHRAHLERSFTNHFEHLLQRKEVCVCIKKKSRAPRLNAAAVGANMRTMRAPLSLYGDGCDLFHRAYDDSTTTYMNELY